MFKGTAPIRKPPLPRRKIDTKGKRNGGNSALHPHGLLYVVFCLSLCLMTLATLLIYSSDKAAADGNHGNDVNADISLLQYAHPGMKGRWGPSLIATDRALKGALRDPLQQQHHDAAALQHLQLRDASSVGGRHFEDDWPQLEDLLAADKAGDEAGGGHVHAHFDVRQPGQFQASGAHLRGQVGDQDHKDPIKDELIRAAHRWRKYGDASLGTFLSDLQGYGQEDASETADDGAGVVGYHQDTYLAGRQAVKLPALWTDGVTDTVGLPGNKQATASGKQQLQGSEGIGGGTADLPQTQQQPGGGVKTIAQLSHRTDGSMAETLATPDFEASEGEASGFSQLEGYQLGGLDRLELQGLEFAKDDAGLDAEEVLGNGAEGSRGEGVGVDQTDIEMLHKQTDAALHSVVEQQLEQQYVSKLLPLENSGQRSGENDGWLR